MSMASEKQQRDGIILLFGMPRSGTTWIGKIFDSHPDTLYRHEPDSWGLLNDIPLLAPVERATEYAPLLRDFAARLPRMQQTKVAASLPIFPKRYCSWPRFQLHKLSVAAAKVGAKALGEFPVFPTTSSTLPRNVRPVWKSIESTGRLGVVARALAPCHAIHILRHPCGYVASVLRGESQRRFEGAIASSEDYGLLSRCVETPQGARHGLSLEALREMKPVERLAWRWTIFNEKAMDDCAGLSHCLALRYEDLCAKPREVARELFDFCGLPWHAQAEAFLGHSTAHDEARYYSITKDPLKSANKWREQLSAADAEAIMRVVERSAAGRMYTDAG